MKCYIRRCRYYEDGTMDWQDTYLAPYYDTRKKEYTYITHWVCDRKEAKCFESVKEAKWFIKTYKVKNCEVYK